MARLSPSGIDRRSKWAPVVDQLYPPVVSPPLPEHSVLAYHQENRLSPSSAPLPPTTTLAWKHGPQPQQLKDQRVAHGGTQGTTVHGSFGHQTCESCGHQKTDQAECEHCGDVDRGHERWQYMQDYADPSLQQYKSDQNQQHISHTQAHEGNQRHESPQVFDGNAVRPDAAPDGRPTTTTGLSSTRASIDSSGVSAASALGYGGPSDWEHFGGSVEEEIDDTELFSRREDAVTMSANDTVELPSRSARALHEEQQSQLSRSSVKSGQGPTSSVQTPLQPYLPPSTASHLIRQTEFPHPTTAATPVATPPSTNKLTPEELTPTERTAESKPANHPQQESVDGAVRVWPENWKVSTEEAVSKQTVPVMPSQSHTIDPGDRSQQQAISQPQTSDLPRPADLGQLRTHPTNETHPKIASSKFDVVDGEEASMERQQHLSIADSSVSKPLQQSEKIANQQFHSPDEPYSDLDSWAKASLSRYIAMLRAEACASTDVDKLHIFASFMIKESLLRTVLYGASPGVSADAIRSLGPQSPEVARPQDVNRKSMNDVFVASSQAESMSPPPTDALLSQHDIPPPPPKHRSASIRTSDSSARALSLAATSTVFKREPSAHLVDPPLSNEGFMLFRRESMQPEKQPLPQVQEPSTPRREPSLPKIESLPSRREPTPLKELTPARAKSARRWEPKATKVEESAKIISTTESYVSTDPEDDAQYSPGGRPIVSHPSRDQPIDRQNVVHSPQHALPSQRATKEASTRQTHDDAESHSPGADAPIVIDAACHNAFAAMARSTSVPPAFSGNPRRTSSPMLPEVASGRPAYTPFRYTEGSPQGSGQPLSAQSTYKAYSAPRQTSLDSGTSMRSTSPMSRRRDTLDSVMSSRRTHNETVGDANVIREDGSVLNEHINLTENSTNIPSSSESKATGIADRAGLSRITLHQSEAHIASGLREAVAALRRTLPADRDRDPTSVNDAQIVAARHAIDNVRDDFGFINKTVVAWDAEAKKIRGTHEKERQLRQEQSEERIDGLFHDNEIGYSDIGALEAEFKKVEAEKRALEEEEEHQSFVRSVFEVVTSRIQHDINHLSGQYDSLTDLLVSAVACKDTFTSKEHRSEISQVLEVLLILHSKLEIRHRKTFEALAERDRRLRKTKLAPLYTEGRITEMKQLEKRLDDLEREAILEANRRRDNRANELVRIVDEHTSRGVGANQDCMKAMLREVRTIGEAMSVDSRIDDLKGLHANLAFAHTLLTYLLANSLRLTQQSFAADAILNNADYDVSVAEARVADADAETFERLREEKDTEDVELKQELEQRDSMVKKDFGIADGQVEALIAKVNDFSSGNGRREGTSVSAGTDVEHEGRIRRALEEAKRRNAEKQSGFDDLS